MTSQALRQALLDNRNDDDPRDSKLSSFNKRNKTSTKDIKHITYNNHDQGHQNHHIEENEYFAGDSSHHYSAMEDENEKINQKLDQIGGITGKVLEELGDEQDNFEAFFTTMFLLGCLLIPLILIFSEYIKPYDSRIIVYLQSTHSSSFTSMITILSKIVNIFYTLKFHTSFCVFVYLAVDPGVAFKVMSTAGLTTYIGFYMEIIIHDSRPYWNSPDIIPKFCHLNFGCPSINILSGFMFYQLMYFNLDRAINCRDPFMNKNLRAMKICLYPVKFLILINFILGVQLVINGENYVYQVLVTYFFGYVLIRVLITFNKDIDYFTNGARYVVQISNASSIWVFIYIIILACFSWIIYSIFHEDLSISRSYLENINVSHIRLIFNVLIYFVVCMSEFHL